VSDFFSRAKVFSAIAPIIVFSIEADIGATAQFLAHTPGGSQQWFLRTLSGSRSHF
jgi:hypothetical protein